MRITKKQDKDKVANAAPFYVVECLLKVCKDYSSGGGGRSASSWATKPCPDGEAGDPEIVPIKLDLIRGLSAVRIYVPKDLMSLANRNSVLSSIEAVKQKFGDQIPMLDPIEDMKIKESHFLDVMKVGQVLCFFRLS